MEKTSINSPVAKNRPVYSLDLRNYAHRWKQHTEVQPVNARSGELEGEPVSLDFYALERPWATMLP